MLDFACCLATGENGSWGVIAPGRHSRYVSRSLLRLIRITCASRSHLLSYLCDQVRTQRSLGRISRNGLLTRASRVAQISRFNHFWRGIVVAMLEYLWRESEHPILQATSLQNCLGISIFVEGRRGYCFVYPLACMRSVARGWAELVPKTTARPRRWLVIRSRLTSACGTSCMCI